MWTLLIVTCADDICLTYRALKRIDYLRAWTYFEHVHLHLDYDLDIEMARALVGPLLPQAFENLHITRSEEPMAWITSRAETMLMIYKCASRWGLDILRLDPDLYINSSKFFPMFQHSGVGISGKLMEFYLPASVCGRPLDFIQGGATFIGSVGRKFIADLDVKEITDIKARYDLFVKIHDERRKEEYAYFLTKAEDVVITGIAALIHRLPRQDVAKIQVSPYDILKNYRSSQWGYDDYIAAFKASGAAAFHFEGRHDDRRGVMSKMLHRYYLEGN